MQTCGLGSWWPDRCMSLYPRPECVFFVERTSVESQREPPENNVSHAQRPARTTYPHGGRTFRRADFFTEEYFRPLYERVPSARPRYYFFFNVGRFVVLYDPPAGADARLVTCGADNTIALRHPDTAEVGARAQYLAVCTLHVMYRYTRYTLAASYPPPWPGYSIPDDSLQCVIPWSS